MIEPYVLLKHDFKKVRNQKNPMLCDDVISELLGKLAGECPVGKYYVCFSAPLEAFCLDKCSFSTAASGYEDGVIQ